MGNYEDYIKRLIQEVNGYQIVETVVYGVVKYD